MHVWSALCSFFFFFNDTATTEIYTLSLHDALPIYGVPLNRGEYSIIAFAGDENAITVFDRRDVRPAFSVTGARRSEEHTSELQSRLHLVCRLLLEKKKKK